MKKFNKLFTARILGYIFLICAFIYVVGLTLYRQNRIDHTQYLLTTLIPLGFFIVAMIVKTFIYTTVTIKMMNSEEYQEKLRKAIESATYGGDIDDVNQIARDYYKILRLFNLKEKPKHVTIDEEHHMLVDEKVLDLSSIDYLIGDDEKNILEEISILFSFNIPTELVEEELNKIIREEWDKK